MREECADSCASRIDELKAEAEVHKETIERLKGTHSGTTGDQ